MTHAVYANPINVAPDDQLAAGLDPPARVRLSHFIDEDLMYVVDEDAVWRGLNLFSASEAIYRLVDDAD